MAKPIKIVVRGTDIRGIDAPTVEDLLSQIQDFVVVLHGVEDALSGGAGEIEWRITDATKNSPITIEVTPFAKTYAMNIDRRAEKVIQATAAGFEAIAARGERPIYFSDALMGKAERIYERVRNGLSATLIDVSEYADAPPIEISKEAARKVVDLVREIRNPEPRPYRELGSVEGFITRVELDGHRRPVVWLRSRIDGQVVKCISTGRGLDRIGHFEVAEVLKGLRVQIFGVIHYRDIDQMSRIDVDGVHVFPGDSDLPDMEDIVDPHFTGGVEASQYLRTLRENG